MSNLPKLTLTWKVEVPRENGSVLSWSDGAVTTDLPIEKTDSFFQLVLENLKLTWSLVLPQLPQLIAGYDWSFEIPPRVVDKPKGEQ